MEQKRYKGPMKVLIHIDRSMEYSKIKVTVRQDMFVISKNYEEKV